MEGNRPLLQLPALLPAPNQDKIKWQLSPLIDLDFAQESSHWNADFDLQDCSQSLTTFKKSLIKNQRASKMGGWVLEVVKMAMYVSFPVGLFHYFNYLNDEEDLRKRHMEYIDKCIGLERFERRNAYFRESKERNLAERDEKNLRELKERNLA